MKSALSRAVTVLWIVSALVGCTATKTFRTDHTPRLQQAHGAMRDVLLVGNSVSGTISVILVDGANYERVGDINVIPDKAERLRDIESGFLSRAIYKRIKNAQLITHFEPSSGDRFVDDVFLSPDGTMLFVSRSNLGDVAAFDLSSPGFPMTWRTLVKGRKADHATISKDAIEPRIVVSASVAKRAYVLDTKTGVSVGSFPTGVLPHQNDYVGKHIYNGSLGDLRKPFAKNREKGDRLLTIVDSQSLKVVDSIPFDWGIRPTVITDDESMMYVQLSYLNGLMKYDLRNKRIVSVLDQPLSAFARNTYKSPDEYPHDSAHHGLAISGDGTLLCDCGTIDNNVSIVSTGDLKVVATLEEIGAIPYWATTSADGQHCIVSLSGQAEVVVIHYATHQVVSRVQVGTFPQRNRVGRMPDDIVRGIAAASR